MTLSGVFETWRRHVKVLVQSEFKSLLDRPPHYYNESEGLGVTQYTSCPKKVNSVRSFKR